MRTFHQYMLGESMDFSALEKLPGVEAVDFDDDSLAVSVNLGPFKLPQSAIRSIVEELLNRPMITAPRRDDPTQALLAQVSRERSPIEVHLHSIDGQTWSLILSIQEPDESAVGLAREFVNKANFAKYLMQKQQQSS